MTRSVRNNSGHPEGTEGSRSSNRRATTPPRGETCVVKRYSEMVYPALRGLCGVASLTMPVWQCVVALIAVEGSRNGMEGPTAPC